MRSAAVSAPRRRTTPVIFNMRHYQEQGISTIFSEARFVSDGQCSDPAARHLTTAASLSTSIGMETTFGCPHAVEILIARDGNCIVCVKRLLTTATTRPSQSSTGAPEAP